MLNVKVLEPWKYSLDGVRVREAEVGDNLELDDQLASDGVMTGHLKIIEGKSRPDDGEDKMLDASPENKAEGGAVEKAKGVLGLGKKKG